MEIEYILHKNLLSAMEVSMALDSNALLERLRSLEASGIDKNSEIFKIASEASVKLLGIDKADKTTEEYITLSQEGIIDFLKNIFSSNKKVAEEINDKVEKELSYLEGWHNEIKDWDLDMLDFNESLTVMGNSSKNYPPMDMDGGDHLQEARKIFDQIESLPKIYDGDHDFNDDKSYRVETEEHMTTAEKHVKLAIATREKKDKEIRKVLKKVSIPSSVKYKEIELSGDDIKRDCLDIYPAYQEGIKNVKEYLEYFVSDSIGFGKPDENDYDVFKPKVLYVGEDKSLHKRADKATKELVKAYNSTIRTYNEAGEMLAELLVDINKKHEVAYDNSKRIINHVVELTHP